MPCTLLSPFSDSEDGAFAHEAGSRTAEGQLRPERRVGLIRAERIEGVQGTKENSPDWPTVPPPQGWASRVGDLFTRPLPGGPPPAAGTRFLSLHSLYLRGQIEMVCGPNRRTLQTPFIQETPGAALCQAPSEGVGAALNKTDSVSSREAGSLGGEEVERSDYHKPHESPEGICAAASPLVKGKCPRVI